MLFIYDNKLTINSQAICPENKPFSDEIELKSSAHLIICLKATSKLSTSRISGRTSITHRFQLSRHKKGFCFRTLSGLISRELIADVLHIAFVYMLRQRLRRSSCFG